jgi:lipoprotein LprG
MANSAPVPRAFSGTGSYHLGMRLHRVLLGMVALIAVLGAGCSDDSSPPASGGQDAAALLRDSAAAMKDVKSTHFTLKVNGSIKGISVHSADGDLTKEGGPSGAAKGKVNMELFGNLFEGEFVLVEDTVYIKGPTGPYQQLPASLVSSVYDPSAILNPDKGISKVLASVQNPKFEGTETVNGQATNKVSARATKDVVSSIVPGVSSDVDITFWLRQDNKQPVKAEAKLPGEDGKPASVEITLSDVDKPVTITKPA